MLTVLIGVLIAGLVFGPRIWVLGVMKRYDKQRDDIPGTGGELARHLLDRFQLSEVSVEQTDAGDHYDPEAKAVRLSAGNFQGRSLTAISVAAHEVGHAIQDHTGYRPLALRSRFVALASQGQRLGAALMMGTPVIVAVLKLPAAGLLFLVAGLLSLGTAVVVHLVTLPVEIDASFRRALPILEAGNYIPEHDRPAARKILTAAALTYVSGALMSLLNVWWWLKMLRR